jgi:pimeloyl-ACP methyl ester carboxylesterase
LIDIELALFKGGDRRMNMNEFYEKYPVQNMKLSTNKEFEYRYFYNPNATHTIVLLTGGIGLSDLFYMHFERFSKDFSVITFDYQLAYESNKEFADAVAELLNRLEVRVWLVGQSLGGIVAQIIAKEHPEVVEGMVLSNTCSLAADMGEEAYAHLEKMIESEKKSKKLLKVIPFGIYKKLMTKMVMKKVADFSEEEKNLMQGLCDAMMRLLTKEYVGHMCDFLVDAENHFEMTKEDFAPWDDKVLLILSEDDHTFTQPCKDSLIRIMTNPTVVTDILGGHLALLIKLEKYSDTVTSYILER